MINLRSIFLILTIAACNLRIWAQPVMGSSLNFSVEAAGERQCFNHIAEENGFVILNERIRVSVFRIRQNPNVTPLSHNYLSIPGKCDVVKIRYNNRNDSLRILLSGKEMEMTLDIIGLPGKSTIAKLEAIPFKNGHFRLNLSDILAKEKIAPRSDLFISEAEIESNMETMKGL